MRRHVHETGSLLFLAALSALGFACGQERPVDAEIVLDAPRPSTIEVSPALDLSALVSPSLAARIVVESIVVNVADARLVGAHPALPSGGLQLLEGAELLEAQGQRGGALELRLPREFLSDEDATLYLRLAGSEALDGASVIVRARLYADPVSGIMSLTSAQDPDGEPADGTEPKAGDDGAQDPDGEPANGGQDGAQDPDGEPANGGQDGAQDPDGEPANGGQDGAQDPDGEPAMHGEESRGLSAEPKDEKRASVSFELRASDEADLFASLDLRGSREIVIGIPATRWFDAELIKNLELALGTEAKETSCSDPDHRRARDERIVVEAEGPADRRTPEDRLENPPDDYFLAEGDRHESRSGRPH